MVAELPVGVGMLRDGVWVWVNAALASLLATTPEAVIGTDLRDVVAPEDRELAWERYRARQLGAHVPSSYEITAIRSDGRRIRLEFEPVSQIDGLAVVLVRDLGEQMRDGAFLGALSELALKVQRAKSAEAIVGTTTAGLRDLGLAACVVRIEGSAASVIGTAVPEPARSQLGDVFEPLLAARFDAQHLAAIFPATDVHGPGYFVDLLDVLLESFAAAGLSPPADLGNIVRDVGLEKIAVSPLVVNERTWGLLACMSSALRPNDAAALALFAAQVATAIEVAASIEGLQRRNEQLVGIHLLAQASTEQSEGTLAPVLLDIVREACASDVSALYLLAEDQSTLLRSGIAGYEAPEAAPETIKLSHSEAQQLLQLSACRSVDAQGFAHSVLVPLKTAGRVGGVLSLARREERRFTWEELRTAEILASQVAVQLERARLNADAQRRLEELSLMNEVGALIAHHLEIAPVLDTAMRHVSRIVDVPNAFLFLLSEDRQSLRLRASNVQRRGEPELRLPLDLASAASRAVLERRPVAVEDVSTDRRASQQLAQMYGHRALLAAPLVAEGRAVGAIVLGETRGARRFTRSELDRSVAVANQLAAAVENARLYSEQRRRVEQLRLLLEMSRVITASLELEPILRAAADALVRMVDATDAFIWFLEGDRLHGRLTSAPDLAGSFEEVPLPPVHQHEPMRLENAEGFLQQKSLLTIPLILRDAPIGVIGVGDRRRTRRFTHDEEERALLISRQLAVAIDNARLFEDLKRSYHELSQAQQELVRRERLAALGELSAVIAHEIRNPLGVIFNSLGTLRRLAFEQEDARMLLAIVGEEAERLNRMVGDLLDFARPNEPRLEPVQLAEVVEGALEAAGRSLSTPAPVTLRAELPEDVPPVLMDGQMIRQAVVNLVVNAIQAMPRGGAVTVRGGFETRGLATFACIRVEDDGPGIPPALADRVFQPFFTTRAAGTGLGLAVVKRIADAHGAELTLESPPGQGAAFTLWIPFVSRPGSAPR